MIPKIIHYCWFGNNPLPNDVKYYIDTWKKYCPDYKIIEWNESNFDINANDYCREAYNEKKFAFVADYARLKIIYDFGGIYMDTDVEIIRSYNDLLNDDLFMCFEDKTNVSIGTFGAIPKHPYVQELLKSYSARHFIIDGVLDLTTNLKYVTELLKCKYNLVLNGKCQHLDLGINIYSSDFFIAKSYITGELEITNNTYAIHHYAGSWLSENQKKVNVEFKKIISHFGWLSKNSIMCKIASAIAHYRVNGLDEVIGIIKNNIKH